MNTIAAITLALDNSLVLSVNGHLVTLSFAPEQNDIVTRQIKQVLISAYSEELGDNVLAIS